MRLPEPEDAIDVSEAIIHELKEKKADPLLIFAALGCAFMHQHAAIGGTKKEWLKLTQEMAEIPAWEKNES